VGSFDSRLEKKLRRFKGRNAPTSMRVQRKMEGKIHVDAVNLLGGGCVVIGGDKGKKSKWEGQDKNVEQISARTRSCFPDSAEPNVVPYFCIGSTRRPFK